MAKNMVMVNNNGQMVLFMMANGNQIFKMETDFLFILMVKFMKEHLFKVKQMVQENTHKKMVRHTLEHGLIINIMVEVLKTGQETYMKVNTNLIKNMEKENLNGSMVLNMKEICL